MGLIVLSAVVAASLHAGNTNTLELSHETAERDRLLFVPAPEQSRAGRVWFTRTPVGSPDPGPDAYGAAPDARDTLIEVRADVVPVVVSPWEDINDVDEHYIRRYRPWIKPTERDRMIREMKRAQHLWLKEQGYIGAVRTHVNPRAAAASAEASSELIEPRGVIRLRPPATPLPANVSIPDMHSITRVSVPGGTLPGRPVITHEGTAPASEPVAETASVEETDAAAS